jgi:hypothetical protein
VRAPSLSVFRHNQVDHCGQRSDFALNEDHKILSKKASTSACIPDVPWQLGDCVELARTVRECVRDWRMSRDAN